MGGVSQSSLVIDSDWAESINMLGDCSNDVSLFCR